MTATRCVLMATTLGLLLGGAPAAAEFARFEPHRIDGGTVGPRPTLDGGHAMLDAQSDRTVILHFFATWCAPCRDELPELARFVAGVGKGAHVIGVDVGEPASRVRPFLKGLGVELPTVLDEDRALSRRFGIKVLPSTIAFIAPNGAVVLASGSVEWAAPIPGLLSPRIKTYDQRQ